jgi:acetylornithine deacetylase
MVKKEQVSSMDKTLVSQLYEDALALLQQLVATPSFSREEEKTASIIHGFLQSRNVLSERSQNNIFARHHHFSPERPSILLNSHHDTVKPNPKYSRDPFAPLIENGKLYGLGSNDAGGALVSLIASFLYFSEKTDSRYNLVMAATAEEEISGANGIEALLKNEAFTGIFQQTGKIESAIVGEPTLMDMAVAERGLLVLDCLSQGKAGHAAREEGENSLYKALKDIEWFASYRFNKVSPMLGPVKMTVTSIETENKAHNVVPAECRFIVDIRINELYSHEEVLAVIREHVQCEVKPRSCRLRSTSIDLSHPLVQSGISMGRKYYGSPTSSDKALMPFPTLKIGPGDSSRSHTADEFIFTEEIRQGIELYIELLNKVLL